MARTPLLQLSDISLTFGGDPILDGLDLVVHPGDKLALVGRNGSGKSTLLKVMAGLVEPDKGSVVAAPGTHVGYMEQDPDMSGFDTLGAFASAALDDGDAYKVDMVAEGLKFDPSANPATASGGERRRAALARLLAQAPELMLLDEPTNHLDINAILWLEEQLRATNTAFVLISHDRAFLRALSRATLWLDRGQMRRQDGGFAGFETWRDKVWDEEDQARHKLNRKIKAEARWAVEGISARRKRNQGRVRALQGLREERASMIKRQGNAGLTFEAGSKSGKRVIEARGISKTYEDRVILRPFDIEIGRGDRIAIVGPNGVGKTTLVQILTGQVAPDAGSVKLGTKLDIALLDQNRSALKLDLTLWDNLAADPELGAAGKADQIMVRGHPRHVVSYLKEFLFDDAQARAPVRSLSGGEKARLLLARLMARESNLLILDEPTNDLDVETLDLLQEVLDDYAGTVIIISHDRDFVDRVATTTIAMEGDGRAILYAGGWSDYQSQRANQSAGETSLPKTRAKTQQKQTKTTSSKMSFTQKHRLEALPHELARLEAEIAKLTEFLSEPNLFETAPAKFEKASAALVERQSMLSQAEEEWLILAELAEGEAS